MKRFTGTVYALIDIQIFRHLLGNTRAFMMIKIGETSYEGEVRAQDLADKNSRSFLVLV